MVRLSARLLLLTCLAAFAASETEHSGNMVASPYGPSSVEISGVLVVTVGIPYGFQCSANCYPGCSFSWRRGNVTSEGPEVTLQLLHVEPTQLLSCTALNPTTGKSVTVQKTLQVTAGPSNIQISGPPMLTIGAASNFTCSADCYPSCSYSWTVVVQKQKYPTRHGSTISVTPPAATVISETLICQAEDTVSHLFISTTLSLWVASVSGVSIAGPSTVTMGKQYSFMCYATCTPSCNFYWKYMGKTLEGAQIQLPVLHQGDKPKFASRMHITLSDYSKTELLTCEAENILSNATVTVSKELTVIDPISVQPLSQALPVASKNFSLLCVGSQNPASIAWLKNKRPVLQSERIRFSADNVSVTFSPLLEDDGGLYQCVVAQGGAPIQSVGYNLKVNFGPDFVLIDGVDVVTVGILYSFQCIAICYPGCTVSWTRGNVTTHSSTLNLKLSQIQPTQYLTCTAVNPTTGVTMAAHRKLPVTAGPSNIQIEGPAFLTAGDASQFSCSAYCYPSCTYAWRVQGADGKTLSEAPGHALSVTPSAGGGIFETVVCRAQDTVSHMFVSASLRVWVASMTHISIIGDTTVTMGERYTYTCFATCVPSCSISWRYMSETLRGEQVQLPPRRPGDAPKFMNRVEITVGDYSRFQALSCEVTNTLSNATAGSTKNISVTDPFSVRPASAEPPVAGAAFALQCVGAQSGDAITWLKDADAVVPSKRLRFSTDNATMSFGPLLRADGGLYQCSVTAGGQSAPSLQTIPIVSIGYQLRVNYGPEQALIVTPDDRPVGQEVFVQPGSETELLCAADCFPPCAVVWRYGGPFTAANASVRFTPVTPPYTSALSCVASNPATGANATAETTVVVPNGPEDASISGPSSLEVGVTASFTCSAACTPSCSFTWTLFGRTVTGRVLDVTASRHVASESISCRAENTYTGQEATANQTLAVSEPHWCGC